MVRQGSGKVRQGAARQRRCMTRSIILSEGTIQTRCARRREGRSRGLKALHGAIGRCCSTCPRARSSTRGGSAHERAGARRGSVWRCIGRGCSRRPRGSVSSCRQSSISKCLGSRGAARRRMRRVGESGLSSRDLARHIHFRVLYSLAVHSVCLISVHS